MYVHPTSKVQLPPSFRQNPIRAPPRFRLPFRQDLHAHIHCSQMPLKQIEADQSLLSERKTPIPPPFEFLPRIEAASVFVQAREVACLIMEIQLLGYSGVKWVNRGKIGHPLFF